MSKPRNKAKGDGIYKDPRSPYWQIDKAFAGARLRQSSGTADRGEAEAIVDRWVAQRRECLILAKLGIAKPDASPKEISVNDACIRYYDEVGCRAKSADAIDADLAWICEHIAPNGKGASTLLSDLTEDMLLQLAEVRRGGGQLGRKKKFRAVSEATINRAVYDNLRTVMERARKTWKKNVAGIDWSGVRTPTSRKGRSTQEMPLSKESEFFAALRPDVHDPTRFLIIHGVRSGPASLLRMEHEHIDFDAGVFKIRRKTREHGDHWQEIPMTEESRAILLAQAGRHPKFVWTYVVHHRHGRWKRGELRPLTKKVLRSQIKEALTAIGLTDFRPHDFRHTMARRTLRTTKDIRLVQRALGHANINTTAIYADVLIDDVRAGLEATRADSRNIPGPKVGAALQSLEGKRKKLM